MALLLSTLLLAAWARGAAYIPNLNYEGIQLIGYDSCSGAQRNAIKESFDEMARLFDNVEDVDWKSQLAADYFGTEERVEPYKEKIEKILQQAEKYRISSLSPSVFKGELHVRCDDPQNMCNSCQAGEGQFMAYTPRDGEVNFCGAFFYLGTLDGIIDEVYSNSETRYNLDAYYNRATAMAHQILFMHKIASSTESSSTASSTQLTVPTLAPSTVNNATDKYVYGALRAKYLAAVTGNDAGEPASSVENYALYVTAKYIAYKKDIYPNMPRVDWSGVVDGQQVEELVDSTSPKYGCYNERDSLGLTGLSSASDASRIGLRPQLSLMVGIAAVGVGGVIMGL